MLWPHTAKNKFMDACRACLAGGFGAVGSAPVGEDSNLPEKQRDYADRVRRDKQLSRANVKSPI